MKKLWIWIISIVLLAAIAVTIFVTIYLPKWRQAQYLEKIEHYYELQGNKTNAANHYAEDVSIIELIATPEKYDGKFVRVIGVGHIQTAPNDYLDSLYLSKEDYEIHTGNAIRLEISPRAMPREEACIYNGKYVIVEGFFENTNGMLYKGLIRAISRYDWLDSEANK